MNRCSKYFALLLLQFFGLTNCISRTATRIPRSEIGNDEKENDTPTVKIGRIFLTVALEDRPYEVLDQKAFARLSAAKIKFSQYCELQPTISEQTDIKPPRGMVAVSYDFRSLRKERNPEDLGVLGIKTCSSIWIPENFKASYQDLKNPKIKEKMTKLQNDIATFLEMQLTQYPWCAKRPIPK